MRTFKTKMIDQFLVLVVFACMAVLHFAKERELVITPEERVYCVILVPIIYVVASAALARVNLPTCAGRAYFMYLFSFILAMDLLLSDALRLASDNLSGLSDQMVQGIALLSQKFSHVSYPIGAAIALYTYCSVFESESGESTPTTTGETARKSLELIGGILSKLDLPVEIKQFLLESAQSLGSLNTQCNTFKQNVDGLDKSMRKLREGSAESYEQMTALAAAVRLFVSEFDGISNLTKVTEANSAVIAKSTVEMLKVLDEFSRLANHAVLSK